MNKTTLYGKIIAVLFLLLIYGCRQDSSKQQTDEYWKHYWQLVTIETNRQIINISNDSLFSDFNSQFTKSPIHYTTKPSALDEPIESFSNTTFWDYKDTLVSEWDTIAGNINKQFVRTRSKSIDFTLTKKEKDTIFELIYDLIKHPIIPRENIYSRDGDVTFVITYEQIDLKISYCQIKSWRTLCDQTKCIDGILAKKIKIKD